MGISFQKFPEFTIKINGKNGENEFCTKSKPRNWDLVIKELEFCFDGIALPANKINLNQCSTIINIPLFINSHLATVKANNGKRIFLPYLDRLKELKKLLSSKI